MKCHQYWPNMVNVPRLYGDIKVTMTEEEEFAFYVIRKFTIQEVHMLLLLTLVLP